MNTSYGQCSLFLCPEQHDFVPDEFPSFISALQKIGFISLQIKSKNKNYYTGDKFLDYIAFMGCSPAIQFEPGDNNNNFCQIKFHDFKSAQLIYSKIQAKTPSCPKCNKPLNNWLSNTSPSTVLCTRCHSILNLEDLNWRKMAGYARFFIEITDIFPKEAIPQQLLMDNLSNTSNTDWIYFYNCQ